MKYRTKIIPYVMTWDGIVADYHRNYLKKPESISFDYLRESLSSNENQKKQILFAKDPEATKVKIVTQKVQP